MHQTSLLTEWNCGFTHEEPESTRHLVRHVKLQAQFMYKEWFVTGKTISAIWVTTWGLFWWINHVDLDRFPMWHARKLDIKGTHYSFLQNSTDEWSHAALIVCLITYPYLKWCAGVENCLLWMPEWEIKTCSYKGSDNLLIPYMMCRCSKLFSFNKRGLVVKSCGLDDYEYPILLCAMITWKGTNAPMMQCKLIQGTQYILAK